MVGCQWWKMPTAQIHTVAVTVRVWHRYGGDKSGRKLFSFFFFAGDLEQKFELEVSPLCNQQKDTIPSIQIGKY